MARITKEEDYAAKRSDILNTAQRLVYTKGYEKMTIQDILDDLQISKGAFYHYFSSKGEVLEALVERMVVEQVEPFLIPIVQDPHLSALEKFQRYIDSAVRWKTANKTLMIELVKVWQSDENALTRQKMFAIMVKRVMPLIMEIIHQGIREGTFTTPYPEYISQVSIYLIQGMSDTFIELFFSQETEQDILQRAENLVAAYNDALERVLGAPKGSIHLMDREALKDWFITPNEPLLIQSNSFTEEAGIPGSRNP